MPLLLLVAKIQFTIENGRLRPYKYLVRDKIGSKYKKPEEIITTLKKAKGIIIPSDDQPEDYSLFDEFWVLDISDPVLNDNYFFIY